MFLRSFPLLPRLLLPNKRGRVAWHLITLPRHVPYLFVSLVTTAVLPFARLFLSIIARVCSPVAYADLWVSTRPRSSFPRDGTNAHIHHQAYQAILRMHFVASEGDVSIISEFDRTDPVEKSLHILKVAFEALFDDVKALVSDGVKADLRRRSKAATTPQEKEIHLQRAEVREKHLKLWMKHKNPLTYGEKSVTYENLLKAISPDDSAVLMGLGAHRNKNVTPKSFADSLFNMSHPIHPTQAVAPVLQSGAFLSVLCVAHSELLLMADHLTVPEREESTKGMFLRAVHHFHISTYPSSLPKSGTSGAPHRKPIFDSWVLLSKKDPLPTSAFGYPSNSVSVLHRTPPETIASINAINDDCNGPWYANKLEMSDLSTIVNKMKLPKDFTISTAPAKYVDDTYKWIIGAYLGTKSIHHLALLVAIIASCSLLPNLFTSKLKSGLFPVGITRSQVDDVYASLKWEPKDIPNASAKQSKSAKKKSNPSAAAKGMTDRGIFIGMITTFIVALYEEESPLRVDMATNPSSGLGDGWTSKHSKSLLSYYSLPFVYVFFFLFRHTQPSKDSLIVCSFVSAWFGAKVRAHTPVVSLGVRSFLTDETPIFPSTDPVGA